MKTTTSLTYHMVRVDAQNPSSHMCVYITYVTEQGEHSTSAHINIYAYFMGKQCVCVCRMDQCAFSRFMIYVWIG